MAEPCKSKRKTSKTDHKRKGTAESPEKSKKKSMPKMYEVSKMKRKFLAKSQLTVKKAEVHF